ncbi:MAG TPA: 50S ribosomal protein L35 [Isosphaeraceae bacterium]|nr:50S ribosomal protein L35 [Isosphaeraceae bacterium]
MPKIKTHKGMKKRFKVTATGKVLHKRAGSSHLMSHKSGKQVRRLRKKSALSVAAEARRIRTAMLEQPGQNADDVHARKMAALARRSAPPQTPAPAPAGEPGAAESP